MQVDVTSVIFQCHNLSLWTLCISPIKASCADDSDGGEFFYNKDEVLNGVGAEHRAALLDHFDAVLNDSDQHELEEVIIVYF
jgi:hypothetical protein